MLEPKVRKIKHKTGKFFGFKEDGWARLGGRWGKKRSYGHFAGMTTSRTKAEIQNTDLRRNEQ